MNLFVYIAVTLIAGIAGAAAFGIWGGVIAGGVAGWLLNRIEIGRMQKDGHSSLRSTMRWQVSAAACDGPVNEKEFAAIVSNFSFWPARREECEQMMRNHAISEQDAAAFNAREPRNQQFCVAQILTVMTADGPLNEQEFAWVQRLSSVTQMHPSDCNWLVEMYSGRENGGGDDRRQWETILGVPPGATGEVIKRAYRSRAAEFHPDKLSGAGVSDGVKKLAEEKFKEVDEAYRNLLATTSSNHKSRGLLVGNGAGLKQMDDVNEGGVAVCVVCRQKNRLPSREKYYAARCGQCHAYLGITSEQAARAKVVFPFSE